jgi:two-component system LytT family response regulator
MTPLARRIRALIVDDEPLARRGVRARLDREEDFDVVGEAASGREAVRVIAELAPDLVFLDVQMPGLDGFGVVEAVGPDRMPVTIFLTAYDQHALRAFDADALDYLLKPIDDERFAQALARARRRIEERRGSALGRKLAAVLAEVGPVKAATAEEPPEARNARTVERFLIKSGGRMHVVPVEEVDWFEAAADYVRLHVGEKTHLLRETMGAIEAQLDAQRFARIHRSTIVNLERIRELQPYFNREYIVVLKDGTKLKLSRSYRERLDVHFGGGL